MDTFWQTTIIGHVWGSAIGHVCVILDCFYTLDLGRRVMELTTFGGMDIIEDAVSMQNKICSQ